MFSNLFESAASILNTAAKVVVAPVAIVVNVADVVTKPIGDIAVAVQEEIKDVLK